MELRMYKFRLYPSKRQQQIILNQFKICKEVYSTLLGLNAKLRVTRQFDVNSLVKDIKLTFPSYYAQVHSQTLQNVSDRLSKAFTNYFNRLKDKVKGKNIKAGFPRFKSKIESITFPQSGFKLLSNRRLMLSKIGNIPMVLHRVPKGKIKTLTIKQNKVGQWFAVFACEMPDTKVIHPSTERVGIDVGIENFATLSNGEVVANPRHLLKAEKRLKFLQRRLSRKVKGSANRRKARFKLAKQHLKVANQRSDFQHKLSRTIANRYATISVEDLNINSMVRNHRLAKHISDASWSSFINMLSYKAVTCGGQLVKVNARNTSKTCSGCGTIIDMPLSKRKFLCPHCGFVCHRDLNASINIDGRAGLARTYTPVETLPLPLLSAKASRVIEAGTTYNNS